MASITLRNLKDIHPRLSGNIIHTIQRQKVRLTCPECGVSLGTHSVEALLAKSSLSHPSGKDCSAKSVGLQTDDLKRILEFIGRFHDSFK